MNGRLIGRIVLGIVVVAVLAGLGFTLYSVGLAQGAAQAGGGPDGAFGWMPGMAFGHRGLMGVGRMSLGFFGPLAVLGFLFKLFLVFGLIWLAGRLFFGFRHGPWGRPGGWRGEGAPPMFEEWHRRAHGEAPSQTATPPDRPANP